MFSGISYLKSKDLSSHPTSPCPFSKSLSHPDFSDRMSSLAVSIPHLPSPLSPIHPFWPRCPPPLETALTEVTSEPLIAKIQWFVFHLHRTQMLSCISEQTALPPGNHLPVFPPTYWPLCLHLPCQLLSILLQVSVGCYCQLDSSVVWSFCFLIYCTFPHVFMDQFYFFVSHLLISLTHISVLSVYLCTELYFVICQT